MKEILVNRTLNEQEDDFKARATRIRNHLDDQGRLIRWDFRTGFSTECDQAAYEVLEVVEDYETEIDDTVHCCPDCETPNQFGELCGRCESDREFQGRMGL